MRLSALDEKKGSPVIWK